MTPRQHTLEARLAALYEQARLDLGLSQGEVAERCARLGYDAMPQTQVSRVLRNVVAMKVDDADYLARALGMTLSTALRILEQDVITAEGEVIPGETQESDRAPNGARRRKPRPVTGQRRAT